MRRAGGLAILIVAVAGCGGSQPIRTVTVAKVATPTTAAKPKPSREISPRPALQQHHRAPRPGKIAPNGEQSIAAITDDDEVVALSDDTVWSLGSSESWSDGDKITVGESEDTLYDATEGESVSATKIGETSDSNTYADEGEHTQEAVSDDGSLIVLDDGSVWAVAAADQSTTSTWTDSSAIDVRQGSAGPNYELINTDEQSSAEAGYVGDK
jgi:hypothetical protein